MVNLLMDEADLNKYTGLSVYVMKFERTRWRRVGDLGGRAFVMAPVYVGASCEAGRLRGDCVYVVHPMSRELQVFDVKDGSMETQRLHEAPFSNKAFWLLPTSC
uniref:KIB1-4 beta-propeller domain-containing protein n=1 Tax=Aegilops tauschii subsp. strangulata TaxID=200361 RepID=A0A453AK52_AEGTS